VILTDLTCIWCPKWGWPHWNFTYLWRQKMSTWAILWHCLRNPMFSHFGTILTSDGQIDRERERERDSTSTVWHSNTSAAVQLFCLCILLCCSNPTRKSVCKNPAAVKYSKGKPTARYVAVDCIWSVFKTVYYPQNQFLIAHTICLYVVYAMT